MTLPARGDGIPPTLAELIAYCQERGIRGRYRAWPDPPHWRARVQVGQVIYTGPADTREAALDRMASCALDTLRDPMPQPGTRDFVAWDERRRARRPR